MAIEKSEFQKHIEQTIKLINVTENKKWMGFYYGRFLNGSITIGEENMQATIFFINGKAESWELGTPITGIDIGITATTDGWNHFKDRRRSVNIGANKGAAAKRGWDPVLALTQLGCTLRLRQCAAPLAFAARLYSYARENILPFSDVQEREIVKTIPDAEVRGFYIRVNGIKIYGETNDGPDDNLTLVLLHTAGRDNRQYHDLISLFGKKFKIVSFDMPGHGKSWPLPNNKVIAEFHQYGDFVWDCIQAMGLKNVMTAGCSMAGCIQYYIAQNYPVKAVCCMQGVEDTSGQTDTRITDMLWHPLVSCQHSHLELTESLIGEKTSQERLDFIYWGVMQETGITKQGDYLELLSFDVKDNMNKITCPVLIIEGMDDQSYTPYMTKLSKERLVNAEYVELDLIPGYGHFIAVESPESVYKYLNEFIDKHVLKK
jgi:pimeloyl-ACP methyl ester carboxylesterase